MIRSSLEALVDASNARERRDQLIRMRDALDAHRVLNVATTGADGNAVRLRLIYVLDALCDLAAYQVAQGSQQ